MASVDPDPAEPPAGVGPNQDRDQRRAGDEGALGEWSLQRSRSPIRLALIGAALVVAVGWLVIGRGSPASDDAEDGAKSESAADVEADAIGGRVGADPPPTSARARSAGDSEADGVAPGAGGFGAGGAVPGVSPLAGLRAEDDLYLMAVGTGPRPTDPLVVGLSGEIVSQRRLGAEVFAGNAALPRQYPGESRLPVIAVDDGIVITSNGRLLHQAGDLVGDPQDLGPGIAALPGPTTGMVWALGSRERTIRLVDIASGESLADFVLQRAGRPVATVGGGLLLSTAGNESPGRFAFWAPGIDAVPLESSAAVSFLGAGGSTIVLEADDEILVYDIDRLTIPSTDAALEGLHDDVGEATNGGEGIDGGEIAVTDVVVGGGELVVIRSLPLLSERPSVSSVSPDGRLIAFDMVTPLTEPNIVRVVDLVDGAVIDDVRAGVAVGYHWSGPSTLLYLEPQLPAFHLVERDLSTGVDRSLLRLAGLSWWYVTG